MTDVGPSVDATAVTAATQEDEVRSRWEQEEKQILTAWNNMSACGPWSSRTRTGTSGSVFPDQAETVHSEQRLTPTAAQVEGRTRGDGVRIPLIPTEEERSQCMSLFLLLLPPPAGQC
ncbi:hypothetical protein JOB18_028455 [Solea senegalensis]|uniref:Uncharacterized protein n=1 Tax=Solea senegalensis TaxID=28829 RepID=A0AAV6Q865_SOLSE|nr:hypothetical protein JOB18_028455 [Solea senegalensis]